MKLNVYATPESIADKELKDKIVVVIDVLMYNQHNTSCLG